MQQPTVRLELEVSPEFDADLRTFLRTDPRTLSSFVEKAVRREMFHRNLQQIKADNAGLDSGEIESSIAEALREVRQDHATAKHA